MKNRNVKNEYRGNMNLNESAVPLLVHSTSFYMYFNVK